MGTTFLSWPRRRWLRGTLAALTLLAACSPRDETPPAAPEITDLPCVVIPRSLSILGYDHQIPDGALWYGGCYNPANANEAAVVADLPDPAAAGSGGHALYRLNLLTGQRTLLFAGVASMVPDWSTTGWILFLRGGEAWKVKANGDSATEFTATNRTLTAAEAWSPDGRLVLCRRNMTDYTQTGLAIYTAKGAFVKLLPDAATRAFAGIGWSPDGRRLAYAGGPNSPVTAPRLCLYDLATDRLDTLDVLPRTYWGLNGVRWLPNGTEVVWGGFTGVGITNVQTHQTRLIRTNCVITSSGAISNRGFGYARPSPDGQRLLLSRGDFALSPTDNNLIVEKHSMETMSVWGGQIRKVTP